MFGTESQDRAASAACAFPWWRASFTTNLVVIVFNLNCGLC